MQDAYFHMKHLLFTLALTASFLCCNSVAAKDIAQPGSFKVGNKTFLLNDKPFVVKAAD